ncbi:MAG: hypothetical protein JJU05_08205 [Verrucomicrobia bacterium]|nr:hypothetical protein [Verrucomicrobiota bacterium]MCH8526730.1 hypothetical protein [Kiritimatiellia bacterium]
MKILSRFVFVLLSAFVLSPAFAQRAVIAHDPPPSVAAGQRLRLIARVSAADELERVTLHLAQSGGVAPVTLPMEASGGGIYSASINPSLFSGASSFRYYIEAHTVDGDWVETDWMTVRVIGNVEEGAPERSWLRPALIGVGVVGGVGAAIILSDSDSGGGGGDDLPPGVDPADQIIVRSVSDTVNAPGGAAPRERSVDVADELRGRRINRVRIRIEFDPVDAGEELYEVVYNGRAVFAGVARNAPRTDQVDVAGAADSRVLIRVLTSEAVEGVFAYRWNATVTYFLSP